MIELTLEQARHLIDGFSRDRGVLTNEQWGAIKSLMDRVFEESERWQDKPSPRYVVFESNDGKSFIIWDTVERKRYSNESFLQELAAQMYADELNGVSVA